MRLLLETGTKMNSLPSWSHDGKWIYFTSGMTHETLTIWRVPASGGQAIQLTKTPSSMPVESPDGQYVYFVRTTDSQFRLWRMRTDGSQQIMMEAMPPLPSYAYDWLPFQSCIYFYASISGKPAIDVLDLQTSRVRRIYTPTKAIAPWGGLAISPDAKYLLYSQIDDTSSDLMLIKNFH